MSEKSTNSAYLALGSNKRPEFYLPAAVSELAHHGRIIEVSRVWENPPVDGDDQPDYLNAAVLLQTDLSVFDLCLEIIPKIEAKLDRVRDPNNKNAPRTIDIDIALFNSEVIQIEHRHIPDPDIETRPFLSIPLADLNADYVHPVNQQSLSAIAAAADQSALQLRADVDLRRSIPDRAEA